MISARLHLFHGVSHDALVERVAKNASSRSVPPDRRHVLAIACAPEALEAKLALARTLLSRGERTWGDGIYYRPERWGPEALAFLYPGQGSQRTGALAALRASLPSFREDLARAATHFRPDVDVESLVYGDGATDASLRDTRRAQAAIGWLSMALTETLSAIGIEPALVAGHSYGELVALWSVGAFDTDTLARLSIARGEALAHAVTITPGAMLAVAASRAEVEPLLDGPLAIASVNSPREVVVAGDLAPLGAFEKRLRQEGITAVLLRTAGAFHSPLMAPALGPWRRALDAVPPDALGYFASEQVFSSIDGVPYDGSPEGVRARLEKQIVTGVDWVAALERLYDAGARIFVEVGPGAVLSQLAAKTFDGRPCEIVSCDPKTSSVPAEEQTAMWLAQLAAAGVSLPELTDWPCALAIGTTVGAPVVPAEVASSVAVPFAQAMPALAQDLPEPGARTDADTPRRAVLEALLASTRRQTATLFRHQVEMLALLRDHNSEARALLDTQERILGDLLQAQIATVRTLTGARFAPPRELPSPEAAEPHSNEEDLVPNGVGIRAQAEAWLRREISRLTGLPAAAIQATTSLEEELGLDSITLIDLWSGLIGALGREIDPARTETMSLAAIRTLRDALDALDALLQSDDDSNVEAAAPARTLCAALAERAGIAGLRPDESFESAGVDVFVRMACYAEELADRPGYALADRALLGAGTVHAVLELLDELGSEGVDPPAALAPPRFVRRIESLEEPAGDLPSGVLLVGPRTEAHRRFSDGLEHAGVSVRSLWLEEDAWSTPGGRRIPFENTTALCAELREHDGDVAYLAFEASDLSSEQVWRKVVDRAACGPFVLAKALVEARAGQGKAIHLGVIGQSDDGVASWASRGVARSLSRERRELTASSLWASEPWETSDAPRMLRTVRGWAGDHDLFFARRGFSRYALAPESIRPSPPLHLDRNSVVVVLGGGDGITAVQARWLARLYKCHIVALGRTPFPDAYPYDGVDEEELRRRVYSELVGNDDPWVGSVRSTVARILRQRALWETRAAIEAAGARFTYRALDGTDGDAVRRAIDAIRRLGPIHGFIHGGGVAEDAPIGKKDLASFRHVLETKAHSGLHFYRALRDEPLRFALLTSSLAAHTGCAGQTDYAAANEILNGIASRWNAEVAYPVRALLWGVWAETGLASEALLNQMRQRGLDGIGNAAGTAAFAAELTAAAEGDWVLLSPISTLEYALSAHAA